MITELHFIVDFKGEPAAGLAPYREEIAVKLRYGTPKEHVSELEMALRMALKEYYDGAFVMSIEGGIPW